RLVLVAIAVHGAGLLVWWRIVGHGPYIDRFEVLSAYAWVLAVCFAIAARLEPRIQPAAVVVYPATFVLIAIGLFLQPAIRQLPPTFRGIWLVLHILFYKIAFASVVIAFVFSVFYLLKRRNRLRRFTSLPDLPVIDLYAYRFAGFGFVFWAIGMVAGSVWAYQSWNIFWNWDPVQTWSLIAWVMFGIYLHLRRFFGWQGERAAWLFAACFAGVLVSLFLTPVIESSIHAEYFK
ncbi:MAG TPA: cytochrome c biogenesis protein CcsA, partial [Anaeromyxobacter sp.]|nr:cytochrome c biogenesis protein CcsA [Anaeromyxobacter sp.]